MDHPSLVICAIFKNEARNLLEWIAYHRVIGFTDIVLYDNGSTDGGADLIRRSPFADQVTLVDWPQRPGQLPAYRHFIETFATRHDWAAFIDLDEFVLPLGGQTLLQVLERREDVSAVLVHWRVFGPAGWSEPAPDLVMETYDLRAEDGLPVNRHVKSIIRCAHLLDVAQNPHEFRVTGPVCNTAGQDVPNIGLQPVACHDDLVINHYYTKSRQEWRAKVDRGSAMFDYTGPKYTDDVFEHLAAACHVRDETIKAYIPQVRALLAGRTDAASSALGQSGSATAGTAPPASPASTEAAIPVTGPAAFAAWPPVNTSSAPRFVTVAPESAPPAPAALPTGIPGGHAPAPIPDPPRQAGPAAPDPAVAHRAPPAPPPSAPAPQAALLQPTAAPPTAAPSDAAPSNAALSNAAPPAASPPMAAPPMQRAPRQGHSWIASGPDAQQHTGGLAMIFRDRSRPAGPWLAAMRGDAAPLIDPEFLLDEAGRLRDFATDGEARSACEAALGDYSDG